MEELGLLYSSAHNVIICQEHGFALVVSGIKRHLQRFHNAQGPSLQAALDEAYSKTPASDRDQILTPPDGLLPVPGLGITPGFKCNFQGCSLEAGGRSANHRTVIRHIKKTHQLAQDESSMIIEVGLQTFFPSPYNQLFAVSQSASKASASPTPSSIILQSDEFLQQLETEYQQSNTAQRLAFSSFANDAALYASQVPPWLKTTGICNFLERLQLEKPVLTKTVTPLAVTIPGEFPTIELLIEQCVYEQLFLVRKRTFAGQSSNSINRPTARILNSFDPARSETKPFVGVQELTTLKRYSRNWSQLLLFLIRISQNKEYSRICEILLPDRSSLCNKLDTTISAAKALQGVNINGLNYADCCRTVPSSPFASGDSSADEAGAKQEAILIGNAAALNDAVFRLSSELSMIKLEHDVFSSAVVAYSAICTLSPTGAWRSAQEFSPFLSSMIHCMQLWILSYSIDEEKSMRQWTCPPSLQSLVQENCHQFLVNTSPSPVAELSYWRLLSRSASNDSVYHPVTTLNEDCTRVCHLQIDLSLDSWRSALQNTVIQANKILDSSLLFNLKEAPLFPVSLLQDSPSNHLPGQSFLDDPRNNLSDMRDWLFLRFRTSTNLQEQFFHGLVSKSQGFRPKLNAFRSYMHSNQLFLQNLAFLIHMTAGLPPRQKELIGLTWCNQETPRNIYIQAGSVVLITSYHKSQWRVGTRPVARYLPVAVGELLVRYLIYVPRFLQFVNQTMQLPPSGAALFHEGGTVWTADMMGSLFKRQTRGQLGIQITTRQWRHIAIALDRHLLQGAGVTIMGISTKWGQQTSTLDGSDSEIDAPNESGIQNEISNTEARIHHLQAAHTSGVNTTVYGNDLSFRNGLTDTLLAAFRQVSYSWHVLAQMTMNNPSKRRHSIEDEVVHKRATVSVSPLNFRKKLWTLPVLQESLRKVLGPSAIAKSHQMIALQEIANCIAEMLIVLPTGGGKTLLYVLPSLFPSAQVTAVIVPLIALKQDLLRRCSEWQIEALCYSQSTCPINRLYSMPSLLFIDVDLAVTDHCRAFLLSLQENGRLDRIVLDEAHLILTASHYREQLGFLGYLRTLHCPFICLTATLPPCAELDLNKALHFSRPKIIRGCTGRHNLRYSIQSILPLAGKESREDAIIQQAVTICNLRSSQWHMNKPAARGLCFVRSKATGFRLAEELGCQFYHAGLEPLAREEMIKKWAQGNEYNILVATSALSAGLDYASVYLVLHIDAPSGMIDYAQETGRGGRDGKPTECIVLLAPKWKVSWESNYCSNFLLTDRQYMEKYLQADHCLRALLSLYLDDETSKSFGVTCKACDQSQICSVCAIEHTELDEPDNFSFGSSPLSPTTELATTDSLAFTNTSLLPSTQFVSSHLRKAFETSPPLSTQIQQSSPTTMSSSILQAPVDTAILPQAEPLQNQSTPNVATELRQSVITNSQACLSQALVTPAFSDSQLISRKQPKQIFISDSIDSSRSVFYSSSREHQSFLSLLVPRSCGSAAKPLPKLVQLSSQVVDSSPKTALYHPASPNSPTFNVPFSSKCISKAPPSLTSTSQSSPAFILDSEEDPIASNSPTSAQLPIWSQKKKKHQDVIDKSDEREHMVLPPRFQLECEKSGKSTCKKLDIGSHMKAVGSLDQFQRDSWMLNTSGKDLPVNTHKENTNDEKRNTYNAASNLVLEEEKSAETTLRCFEQRVAIWGVGCIPCSFNQCKPIEGYHSDCLEDQHSHMIDQFWLSIKFDRYIGCFRCGFPEFICSMRGKSGCKQARLLYTGCWTALCLDKAHGPRLLELLGGPVGIKLSSTSPIPPKVIKWLGLKQRIGGKEACNASVFLCHWFDFLEDRCK